MEIRAHPDGFGIIRAALNGELDLATVDLCESRLLGLVSIAGAREVILDLGRLNFVDCAGLRALIVARSSGAALGVDVRVERPQPIVETVLRVTGLWESFKPAQDAPVRRQRVGDSQV